MANKAESEWVFFPPTPESDEYPLYCALKIEAYERVYKGAPTPGNFRVRQLRHLVPNNQWVRSASGSYTLLFGRNSYYFRERMHALNHGTVLAGQRGLRNSMVYEWMEPIENSALRAYGELRGLTDRQVAFASDLQWVVEEFDRTTFRSQTLVRRMLEYFEGWGGRPAGRRKVNDLAFSKFLMDRVSLFIKHGLMERVDHQGLRVTPKGRMVAHWFLLFMTPVDFAMPDSARA